ncbi:MAG TPA: hypothetical protein VH520_10615 [Streptosporangiaceae bacterium]|jgi:hypothetical protein
MTGDVALSRPLLLAAQLTGDSPAKVRARLLDAAVHARVAAGEDSQDAAILARSLVDQLSRFCGTVAVSAPDVIVQACVERDRELHDPPRVHAQGSSLARADALGIFIGGHPDTPGGIGTCSDGWTGKVIPAGTREPVAAFMVSNPIGALTGAALTAGEAFFRLIGLSRPSRGFELSAWSGACGPLGSLPDDPLMPAIPPIDALLIGCGNVMNGWAAAARALRITGHARVVDRQSLGGENLGPYSLARRDMIGQPKTLLLARLLEPLITVARHDEELSLFLPRITRWHLPLPPLVVNGLDEVEPRHMVQRLWPEVLVDMAAGGTTSQVIVHQRGQGGQCLLRAYEAPDSETGYIRRTEAATGLRRERFLSEFTTPVTAQDVAQAPPEHRARLQAAADSGQLICGYINQASLTETSGGENFAAAAPFLGALTGARAAAVTVALLAGHHAPGGLRWQYNFLSNRARTAETRCPGTCECQTKS